MIRTTLMALTALAATAALTAPASAEQSMTVKLAGKSTAASYVAIVKAARAVCKPDTGAEIYSIFVADDCVKTTISAALDKVADPALSQYAANREALALTLASN